MLGKLRQQIDIHTKGRYICHRRRLSNLRDNVEPPRREQNRIRHEQRFPVKKRRSPQYSKHHVPDHSRNRDAASVKIPHECRGRNAHQAFYTVENTPQDDPLRHCYWLAANECDPEEAGQSAVRDPTKRKIDCRTALDREDPIPH
jgi:hypothetical protein